MIKKNQTVLVVDDDESTRWTVGQMLMQGGYEVLEAASANEALTCLSLNAVDLVLSDIHMPDGDGFYLFEAIKRLSNSVPLVFMSGHVAVSLEEVLAMGALYLFQKPFEADQLLAWMSSYFVKERRGYSRNT